MGQKKQTKLREVAKTLFMQGLPQTEIADKLGVSKVSVSRWSKEENWDVLRKNLVNSKSERLSELYDELAARLGEKLGESEWLLVDQGRINLFADATLDHQWIHVDTERAAVESQFKSTIAHGYLTLSLLPHMWQEIIEVNNLKMMVNYGMDKMRFGRPVLVNSRIRLVATLDSIENIRGICKAGIKFQIEIEGERKPALEGVATFLYYFE